MPFSKQELIEQLEYEKFTYEQAVYGVELLDIDFGATDNLE